MNRNTIKYPELTDKENALIVRAREAGYAEFFPAYPNAEAQARNTLAGATRFLASYQDGADARRLQQIEAKYSTERGATEAERREAQRIAEQM